MGLPYSDEALLKADTLRALIRNRGNSGSARARWIRKLAAELSDADRLRPYEQRGLLDRIVSEEDFLGDYLCLVMRG